jgi:predicted nucleic acid-binding protein
VKQPGLLRAAFATLAVPEPVLGELLKGEELGVVPTVDWTWLPRVQLTPAEASRAQGFLQKLEMGESACLAVAEARGGFVLTDDLDARHFASALNLDFIGTLGVLDQLIQIEVLSIGRAEELLAVMIARGYRSPVRSLREILPGAGRSGS